VWQRPFAWLGNLAPIFSPEGAPSAPKRRYAFFLGQSLFTPKNLRLKPPDPRDQPYAGRKRSRARDIPWDWRAPRSRV
jgi:lipid A 3-O-deacylase